MIEKIRTVLCVPDEIAFKVNEIIDETNTHEECQSAAIETICGRLNDLQGQIINIEKVVGRAAEISIGAPPCIHAEVCRFAIPECKSLAICRFYK
jgi:hypothetical protein